MLDEASGRFASYYASHGVQPVDFFPLWRLLRVLRDAMSRRGVFRRSLFEGKHVAPLIEREE
jgi:hypothetical protein